MSRSEIRPHHLLHRNHRPGDHPPGLPPPDVPVESTGRRCSKTERTFRDTFLLDSGSEPRDSEPKEWTLYPTGSSMYLFSPRPNPRLLPVSFPGFLFWSPEESDTVRRSGSCGTEGWEGVLFRKTGTDTGHGTRLESLVPTQPTHRGLSDDRVPCPTGEDGFPGVVADPGPPRTRLGRN